MKHRAFLPLGFLAVASLALASPLSPLQGIVLKRTPKVGEKTRYKLNGTFPIQGIEVTITGMSTEEVTKVENDEVTRATTETMTVNVMGNEQVVPETVTTSVSKLDGTPVSIKSAQSEGAAALRNANLMMLFVPATPVEIGKAWTAKAKVDMEKDLPGYEIEYKLVGEEKSGAFDTYKITSKGKETEGDAPSSIEGTYWVEKSTGRLVRSILNIKDMVFGGAPAPMTGKMELNLQP